MTKPHTFTRRPRKIVQKDVPRVTFPQLKSLAEYIARNVSTTEYSQVHYSRLAHAAELPWIWRNCDNLGTVVALYKALQILECGGAVSMKRAPKNAVMLKLNPSCMSEGRLEEYRSALEEEWERAR